MDGQSGGEMSVAVRLLRRVTKKTSFAHRLSKSLLMAMRAKIEKHNQKEIQLLPWEKKTLRLPDFSCLMDIENGMAGHQLFLFNLTREIKAQEVLEIGLGMANSTLAFLLALRETGGRLTTVDIAPMLEAIARIETVGLKGHWRLVQGASRDVRGRFPPDFHLDILFIDGNHSYNQCKSDYKLYSPLVREGGYIIFHDSATIAGVMKLTNELKQRGVEYMHFPYCNGMFVIHKPTRQSPGGLIP
jgi:predicted O-methyltransferase YrrM